MGDSQSLVYLLIGTEEWMTSLKGEVAPLGEGLAHWANKQGQVVAYIHGVDLTWQGRTCSLSRLCWHTVLNWITNLSYGWQHREHPELLKFAGTKKYIQVQDPCLGGMASFHTTLVTLAKAPDARPGQAWILEATQTRWGCGWPEKQRQGKGGRTDSCPGIM